MTITFEVSFLGDVHMRNVPDGEVLEKVEALTMLGLNPRVGIDTDPQS